MNKLLFFTLFLLTGFSANAQSLFFDQLNGSVWTSNTGVSAKKPIGLQKTTLENAKAYQESEHIWTFKDGRLIVESFQTATGTWRITGSYSYTIDETSGTLLITTESQELLFQAGIVSTGNLAYLLPAKERKNR